jgi:hypothetical protein
MEKIMLLNNESIAGIITFLVILIILVGLVLENRGEKNVEWFRNEDDD